MIKGQGVDIVEIKRINSALERFGDRFIARILTPVERQQCSGAAYLAKRFAAKEAVAKALGTGIGKQVSFQDITVARQPGAAAQVQLANGAATQLAQLGATRVWLSISDERDYAVAMVTIE